MSKTNLFKTADIRIATDSVGVMTATHKFQGTLIDGDFFTDRAACRREAVKVLAELKQTDTSADD